MHAVLQRPKRPAYHLDLIEEVQIIKQDGKPAFAVVPYED
jgi:hypothetical protein